MAASIEELGEKGLRDGSSRPHHSPNATDTEIVGKIIYLRQNYHLGPRNLSQFGTTDCGRFPCAAKPTWGIGPRAARMARANAIARVDGFPASGASVSLVMAVPPRRVTGVACMVDPDDLIDAGVVAEILSLSTRNVVSVYRSRSDTFPAPLVNRGTCVLWLRSDIESWGATR